MSDHELHGHANASKGRLRKIGIQSDELRKILGVTHAERHALAILADLDRFAGKAGILGCKLCRFAGCLVGSCAAQRRDGQECQACSAAQ
jgi:hypothetical protein